MRPPLQFRRGGAAFSRKAAPTTFCRKEAVVFTQVRFSGQLDSKGRVTIPSRIRDKLGLEPGDRISLGIESCEVVRKKFDSRNQALSYLSGLEDVKSFSFDGKVLEVVLGESF